jgi:predicted hydrocarbon binding protein
MSEEQTKAQEPTNTEEKKEAEIKPATPATSEVKPAEAKPTEAKPAEVAPAADKPADPKPAEAKPSPAATTAVEAKPAEAKTSDPKPADVKAEAPKSDDKIYYYPNKWARIVFTSAEEVMGDKGVNALLNLANMKDYIDNYPPDNMKKEFPFEKVGQLQQGIWDMYGNRGARVFATRAGEQSFKDGLSQFKSVANAAQIAMKVGSLEAKAKIGLEFFSKFFNAVSDQVVEISEDEKHWIWTITRCPVCWNRKSDEAVCHLAVGVLQAAFAWISNNKKFRIQETECKAKGDTNCVFMIEKVPVE